MKSIYSIFLLGFVFFTLLCTNSILAEEQRKQQSFWQKSRSFLEAFFAPSPTPKAMMLAPNLLVDSRVDKPTPGSNEVFTYKIRYRCASTTEHCTDAYIDLTIDSDITIVGTTPVGGNVNNITITGQTLRFDLVSPPSANAPAGQLAAGSSGIIEVKVRFNCKPIEDATQSPAAGTTINLVNPVTFYASGASTIAFLPNDVTVPTFKECNPPRVTSTNFDKRRLEAGNQAQAGGTYAYRIDAPDINNSITITDTIPEYLTVTDFSLDHGSWNPNWIVECDCGSGWKTLPTTSSSAHNWVANNTLDLNNLPDENGNPTGCSVTYDPLLDRYLWHNLIALQYTTPAAGISSVDGIAIYTKIDEDTPIGTVIQNCAVATSALGVDCEEFTIVAEPTIDLKKYAGNKFGTTDISQDVKNVYPEIQSKRPDDIVWMIWLTYENTNNDNTQNFVIEDELPTGLEFVMDGDEPNWWVPFIYENTSIPNNLDPFYQDGCNNPTFIPETVNGKITKLRWEFPNCILPGGTRGETGIWIIFSSRYDYETPLPLNLNNRGSFSLENNEPFYDLTAYEEDGIANTSVTTNTASMNGGDLSAIKWVKGAFDNNFHRYPSVGNTDLAGTGVYEIYIYNHRIDQIDEISQIDLVDILPHINDLALISGGNRDSDWSAELANAITVERFDIPTSSWVDAMPNITNGILYSNSYEPCYIENIAGFDYALAKTNLTEPAADCSAHADSTFSNTNTPTGAKSFAFSWQDNGNPLQFGEGLKVTVNIQQLTGEADKTNGEIAWNSFAYTAVQADGDTLLSSEPIKVGLKMIDPSAFAALGNLVWMDDNANGIQDGAEKGIEGVTVHLYDNAGAPILVGGEPLTAKTDSNGYYCFVGLTPNLDYIIRLDEPINFVVSGALNQLQLTTIDAGADDKLDSDAALGDNAGADTNLYPQILATTPAAGEEDKSFDFGFFKGATIGNYLWLDADGEGDQDNNELALDSLRVELLDQDGNLVMVDSTDNNGFYRFDQVPPGVYQVKFADFPDSLTFTSPNLTGNIETDSDVMSDSTTVLFSVASCENNQTIDAGFRVPPADPATIKGVTWEDLDKDGIRQGTESLLSGITVQLLDDVGLPIQSAVTDTNGRYCFNNLVPDEIYQVVFSIGVNRTFTLQEQGGDFTIDSDALPADGTTIAVLPTTNETIDDIDAGICSPLSLGNLVWEDVNNNGLYENGEPTLANVTVYLIDGTDGTTYLDTTVTDANGRYLFGDLMAGDYIVEVEIPTAMESTMDVGTTPTPNQLDNDDNGVGTPNSGRVQSAVITLANNGGTNGDANWTESDKDAFIHGVADPTPNPKAYYTVDFGFYTPCLLSIQSVTPSTCDSTTNNYHLTVELNWSNAPVGSIQLATNNGDTTTVSPSGSTGAQSFLWENLTSDGVANITLTATFVNNTNCTASLPNAYNAPIACVEGCRLKIFYLCGNNKYEDAYAWDHGMIRYLESLEGIGTITSAFTKNSGADLGLYDPESNNDPVSIDVSEFDCIFISNSVGTNYKQELSNALRELPTPMVLMNRHMLDDFGMTASNAHAASVNQDDAYDGTTQIQLYDFATYNPNPTDDPVVIHGDYLPNAEVYLWLDNAAHTNGDKGVFFTYDETDVLLDPSTNPYPHGKRTYLGYTVDAIYQNATDNSIPSPESAWLDPAKHFTPAGKYYIDQALMMGDKPCEDSCNLQITATYTTNCTPITNGYEATLNIVVDWKLPPINEMISVSLDGANAQTIDVINTVSPDTLQFTIAADGSANHQILAQFETSTACSDSTSLKYPVPCPSNLGGNPGDICTNAADEIAGTVFEDWNYDGLMNQNDTIGVAGILVTATDCDGNVDTTYTDANGNYQFTGLTNGEDYRIEFSLPEAVSCWACPTHAGGDNGTMVQFVQVGDCAHLGIASPMDYCQLVPELAVPCYVNGDISNTNEFNAGYYDFLVSFPYTNSGQATMPKHLATGNEIGTTWGIAYDRLGKRLFSAAFLKRHTDLAGPNEGRLGGIYVTADLNTATPTNALFVDLTTLGVNVGQAEIADRPDLALFTGDPSQDSLAFSQIAKVGLGDIDLSEDGSTLYIVNVYEKTVVILDVATQMVTAELPIPDMGCINGETRPFAIAVHRGEVYIGAVCSGEYGGTSADLVAQIWHLTHNHTFNSILGVPLSLVYNREKIGGGGEPANWLPWTDVPQTLSINTPMGPANNSMIYPQPILSDIEFDVDGSLILGFIDRTGHQVGNQNHDPSATYNMDGASGGDIIRLCKNNMGSFVVEGTTACSYNHTFTFPSVGGEYYWGEFQIAGGGGDGTAEGSPHQETAIGGLALVAGQGQVLTTAYNPYTEVSGGILWLNNRTGDADQRYELFNSSDDGSFGKAHGLGDIEAMCDPAPLEIGNYVWLDTNEDGIQDACETPLAEVIVTLYGSSCKICAIDTTDAFGNYYFNDAKIKDYTAEPDTSLNPNSTYYIVITGAVGNNFDTTNGALIVDGNNYQLTTTDQGTNDQIDSDGAIGTACGSITGFPFVTAQTTKAGCNDHSYDFGFTTSLTGAQIGNFVWIDANENGAQDTGEPGVEGIKVWLYDTTGVVKDSAITNSGGYYLFDAVTPNGYYLQFGIGSLWTISTPNAVANDSLDSDIALTTKQTANFIVLAGDTNLTFDVGVSACQYNLVVTSHGSDQIFLYDGTSGSLLKTVEATTTTPNMNQPNSIACGPDGLLYISDFGNNKVLKFSSDLTYVGDFITTRVDGAEAFAFGTSGDAYLMSWNTQEVLRYDQNGVFKNVVADGGDGLNGAQWMDIDDQERIYVGLGTDTIKRFTPDGTFIDVFTVIEPIDGPGADIGDLRFGPNGHLYAANYSWHSLNEFDSNGNFVGHVIPWNDPVDNSLLLNPKGFVFGPDGNIYITSSGNNKVFRFNEATGTLIDEFITQGLGGLVDPFDLKFVPADCSNCPPINCLPIQIEKKTNP